MNAYDLRVHFVRRALYWRREMRKYSNGNLPMLREWCEGRYYEARDAMEWVKERAEVVA